MNINEKRGLNPLLQLLVDNTQYHYRYEKRISVYLMDRYSSYIKSLEQSIADENFIDRSFCVELEKRLPSIKKTTNNILKAYELYEENKILDAESISRKVLSDNKSNMLIRFLNHDERSLYRIRPNNNYPTQRKELFHVSMRESNKCKDGRFSKEGVPCLYLATQLPLSWIEMNKPEIFMAAKYELIENMLSEVTMIDIVNFNI